MTTPFAPAIMYIYISTSIQMQREETCLKAAPLRATAVQTSVQFWKQSFERLQDNTQLQARDVKQMQL